MSDQPQSSSKNTIEDEFSALVASTGGTAVQQSNYEEEVLFNATLRDAPQLPLHAFLSSCNEHTCTTQDATKYSGLPKLATLCGVAAVDSNVERRNVRKRKTKNTHAVNPEHVTLYKILTKTRNQLSRLRQNNTNTSTVPLNLQFGESKDELKLNMKVQIMLSYFESMLGITNPDEHFEATLEIDDERQRAYDCAQRGTNVSRNKSGNKKQKSIIVPDPSQNLERIKKGLQPFQSETIKDLNDSHVPSFGKQALIDRKKNANIKLAKRGTMMDFKKQMLDEADRRERPDLDITWLMEKRRKKREERSKRRLERCNNRDMENRSHTDVERNDNEYEMKFDDECVDISNKEDSETKDHVISTENPFREIICPICNNLFQISVRAECADDNVDAFLTSHITDCQRRGGRVTRSSKTLQPFKQINAIRKLDRTTSFNTVSKKKQSFINENVSSIDDMDDFCYDDRVEDWMEYGISSMKTMEEKLEEEPPGTEMYEGGLVIPSWMNNRLFGYQRTGLRWMWELHKQGAGGLVGDEMGLGKTVQVSSFLGAMTSSRMLESVLIIAPATMLRHWLSELKLWAPGLRRILLHNSGETDGLSRKVSLHLLTALDKWLRKARKYRINEPIDGDNETDIDSFCGTGYVVLTTYEQVRMNEDLYTNHYWSYIILDEGQKIRNPDAEVTLACKRFRTPHRLLLSGTPIQNDLRELWSLFDFCFPGRLGTLPAFELEFADPIKRGGYANASKMQVQLAYRCALTLRDLINPYMLRRQKKDIKEVEKMPGKTEQVLFCRLTARQRAMYEAYLSSDEVIRVLAGNAQCFRSITILRKLCNHPDLICNPDKVSYENFVSKNGIIDYDSNDSSSEDECFEPLDATEEAIERRSGKLEVLSKILPLWHKQGHRVLIFSQTRQMLNILQTFVSSCGLKFLRLDGNTGVNSRQNLIDKFNSNESIFGMLLTTRTGGVGVNLTGANRIVVYDPDWNPQVDAQSRERAWRFGQKREVTVYRLITAGTIEEKIYHRQIFKTAISNQILQDPRQRRIFSQKDLKDLFTLKEDIGSMGKGGGGVTETGAKLGSGVIQPTQIKDLHNKNEESLKDNIDALKSVLSSKGLAGIWDHDFSSISKFSSANDLEDEAVRVAKKAAESLRSSVSHPSINAFQPTWTGSDNTKALSRFGRINEQLQESTGEEAVSKVDSRFGSASVAGVKVAPHGGLSSNVLLDKLKRRQSDTASTTLQSDSHIMSDVSKYAKLQTEISLFLSKYESLGGPKTEQLLDHFCNIPDRDAAIFKRLLNNVAHKKRDRWTLKE